MKEDTEEIIKIKVAVTLRILLRRNKSYSNEKILQIVMKKYLQLLI